MDPDLNHHLIASDSYKEYCYPHLTSWITVSPASQFSGSGEENFHFKRDVSNGPYLRVSLEKNEPPPHTHFAVDIKNKELFSKHSFFPARQQHISVLAPRIRTRLPSRNCFEDEAEPSPHPQTTSFLQHFSAGKQRIVAAAGKLLSI